MIIFTAEILIKLFADGKWRIYWSDPWNKFDFLVVSISYVGQWVRVGVQG